MSTWSRRISSASLVGRDDEVRHVVEAATPNRRPPSVVLVAGPPGIGKTRLVGEAARRLRAAGAQVLLGACHELSSSGPPYAALIAAFRQAPTHHGEAAVALMTGTAPASRAALFEQARNSLARLAAGRPTVLVIEDVHWVDQGTRDVLAYLVSAVRAGRWSLVVTYREEDLVANAGARRLLAALEREPAHHLEVGPLPVEAVREQMEQIAGEPTERAVAARIHARTGGIPLYVEEVLAAEAAGISGVPAHLRATFLERVDGLPEPVRDAVVVVAVTGPACDASLAAAVLDREVDEVDDDLVRAVAAGVLARDADGFRLRHELLREAVVDDVPARRRRALHRAVATSLARRTDTDAASIAEHWAAAGDDARAGAAYLAAAEHAARLHSPGSAHAHLEQVLSRWDRLAPESASVVGSRTALLARAAEAAALAGSPRAVPLGELWREAARDDPVELASACERLARYSWVAGDGRGARAAFDAALGALPPDAPDDVRARVLAGQAWILSMSFRGRAGATPAEDALAAARRSGSPLETCRALLAWGATHPADPRTRDRLEEARRLAVDLDSADEIARSHIALAFSLQGMGRDEERVAVLDAGLDLARVHGIVSYQAVLGYLLLGALIDVGRWRTASEVARQVEGLPVAGIARAFGSAERARLAAVRGDSQADAAAAEALELTRDIPEQPAPAVVAHLAVAESRLWSDDPAAALGRARRALDLAAVDPGLQAAATAACVRAAADLAGRGRAQAERGGDAVAWAALIEALPTAGVGVTSRVQAHVVRARAELGRLGGTPGGSAADAWREAIAAAERAADPYGVAYGRWRLAQALLLTDAEGSEVAPLLRTARHGAQELGARPLLRAVNRTLASATPRHLREPAEGALTPREREVLQLLAAGRTNAEIADSLVVSTRTVGVHVSHLLHKLGAARRTEAAAIARRTGLLR